MLVYREDLDWLRAIAVTAVFMFHLGYLPDGYLGVDVFFVLSGYLITGKIIDEIKRGTFTLRNFYINRIRRLLPAYYFLAMVVTVFVYILSSDTDDSSQYCTLDATLDINYIINTYTGGILYNL